MAHGETIEYKIQPYRGFVVASVIKFVAANSRITCKSPLSMDNVVMLANWASCESADTCKDSCVVVNVAKLGWPVEPTTKADAAGNRTQPKRLEHRTKVENTVFILIVSVKMNTSQQYDGVDMKANLFKKLVALRVKVEVPQKMTFEDPTYAYSPALFRR